MLAAGGDDLRQRDERRQAPDSSGVGVHAFAVAGDFAFSATTDVLGAYTIRTSRPPTTRSDSGRRPGTWSVEWYDDKADFTTANTLAVDVRAGT